MGHSDRLIFTVLGPQRLVFSFLSFKLLLVFLCYQVLWCCFAFCLFTVIHVWWSQLLTAQAVGPGWVVTSACQQKERWRLTCRAVQGRTLGLSLSWKSEKRSRVFLPVWKKRGRGPRAELGLAKFRSWMAPLCMTTASAALCKSSAVIPVLCSFTFWRPFGMQVSWNDCC